MARQLALLALIAAAVAAALPPSSVAKEADVKTKVESLLGDALSAKEAAVDEVKAKESKLRSKAEVGYPFDLYPECVRTAAEWKAAWDAGEVPPCVAPWLYFRAPDSAADVADPTAAGTYIKGPDVSLAFAAPGTGTLDVLAARAECVRRQCSPQELLAAILDVFKIDPSSYPAGARIPLKIFGSDASIWLGTNKGVSAFPPTWPAAFDAIRREFSLDPRLLGDGPLRELVTAYSYSPTTLAAYQAVTGCTTTQPDCSNRTADANATCEAYAAALGAFCKPDGSQNYDTASCVAALKKQPTDADGAVSAVTARAFYTACLDMYFLFTANGFVFDGTDQDPTGLASREFLLTGDAKLAQTGGYEVIWLGA